MTKEVNVFIRGIYEMLCSYCGRTTQITFEDDKISYDVMCPHCNKSFIVTTSLNRPTDNNLIKDIIEVLE